MATVQPLAARAGPAPPAGPSPVRHILCTIDFSPTSVAVIAAAVSLARAAGGEIEVLFVVPYAAPSKAAPARLPSGIDSAVTEDVEALLAPARAAGIPVRVCLKVGTPTHEILQEIRRTSPDIVVMGTHGRHGLGRRILGSVANEVIRQAPCPVMTVSDRAAGGDPSRRVVCAVALSPSSASTLAYARALAGAIGGELTVIHVATGLGRARAAASQLRSIAAAVDPAGGAEEVIARGDPASQVARMAAALRAALLVVGRQRLPGAIADVRGSVGDKLVRCARCPVVSVLRDPEGARC